MTYRVVYTPRARRHLDAIYDYIADHAGPEIARRYTRQLESLCEALEHLPMRGTPRDDIRPRLRTLAFRRRAVIVYSVEKDEAVIHGVFYAGRDFEAEFGDAEPVPGD